VDSERIELLEKKVEYLASAVQALFLLQKNRQDQKTECQPSEFFVQGGQYVRKAKIPGGFTEV